MQLPNIKIWLHIIMLIWIYPVENVFNLQKIVCTEPAVGIYGVNRTEKQ